ncbi:MAG: hypothetical protein UU20_C0041G0001, partial [Parcubacteria group bacterium GW2011_GWE2_40_8]
MGGGDVTYLPTDAVIPVNVSSHFDNPIPAISGPISRYILKDATDPSVDVTQAYGLYINASGQLTGQITANLQPMTNRLIHVFAINNQGISTTYATYHLNIGAPQLPSIVNHDATATPPHFIVGQPVTNYIAADIYANNGILLDVSTTLKLSGLSIANWNATNPDGLIASIKNITNQHAQILLNSNGPLTTPTYSTSPGQINLMGIQNSYQQIAASRVFNFYIAAPPSVKSALSNLGGESTYYHTTDTFIPIQHLTTYFDNPTGSGAIKPALHVTDLDAPSVDVKTTYGLSAENETLEGTIPGNAPFIDHHRLQICAENTIGISTQCAIYHLTINSAKNPNIIIQPIDPLTVGSTLPSITIATVHAGEGTLDVSSLQINGESLDAWNQQKPHGLTLTYTPNTDQTTASLTLSANLISQPTYTQPDTFTITGIKNSYGESQSDAAHFVLNVADIPTVDPAQSSLGSATLKQGQALTTITGLNTHFKNPTASGEIDQFDFSADTKLLANTYHLMLDASGNLFGQIPLNAPPTTGITFKIVAHNTLGWSKTFATYQLSVEAIGMPGETPLSPAIFSRGQQSSIGIATIQSTDSPLILDSIKMNGIPVSQWTKYHLTATLQANDVKTPTTVTVVMN